LQVHFGLALSPRKITDHIIDSKINGIKERIIEKIKEGYLKYSRDLCISITLNALIVITTLVFHFIFTVNPFVICLISVLTMAMFTRIDFIKANIDLGNEPSIGLMKKLNYKLVCVEFQVSEKGKTMRKFEIFEKRRQRSTG
jgi:hypothetical protein